MLVARYFELEDPTAIRPIGLELQLEAQVGGLLTLRGIIDRLELDADGELVVTDYKTGRAPRPSYEQGRLGGVHFYAFLCEQVFGERPADGPAAVPARPAMAITPGRPSSRSGSCAKRTDGGLAGGRAGLRDATTSGPGPAALCDWCAFQACCPAFGGDPDRAALEAPVRLRPRTRAAPARRHGRATTGAARDAGPPARARRPSACRGRLRRRGRRRARPAPGQPGRRPRLLHRVRARRLQPDLAPRRRRRAGCARTGAPAAPCGSARAARRRVAARQPGHQAAVQRDAPRPRRRPRRPAAHARAPAASRAATPAPAFTAAGAAERGRPALAPLCYALAGVVAPAASTCGSTTPPTSWPGRPSAIWPLAARRPAASWPPMP